MDSEREQPALVGPNPPPDPVNHPPHYTRLNPQPLDIIDAWELSFYPAQVLKYIARAGFKDPKKLLEDLKKAEVYLQRWIRKVQAQNG